MANTTTGRLTALEKRMETVETDIKSIKGSMNTIDDIADMVSNICKWIKRGLPLVATAPVTSGLVSGKWGAFIQALFH